MPYELVRVSDQTHKCFWLTLVLIMIFFYVVNYLKNNIIQESFAITNSNSLNLTNQKSSDFILNNKSNKISFSKNNKLNKMFFDPKQKKSNIKIPPIKNKASIRQQKLTKYKNTQQVPTYNLGVCSKNCCATQWPVPIDLKERSGVKLKNVGKGRMYSTSNLMCNNGVTNTGCVCLTQESKQILNKRGFVHNIPTGNGILEADNKPSAFKIMEDSVSKPINVLGQTTELIGDSSKQTILSGRYENKFDKRTDKFKIIESDKELAKKISMPINNNMIDFNNRTYLI